MSRAEATPPAQLGADMRALLQRCLDACGYARDYPDAKEVIRVLRNLLRARAEATPPTAEYSLIAEVRAVIEEWDNDEGTFAEMSFVIKALRDALARAEARQRLLTYQPEEPLCFDEGKE